MRNFAAVTGMVLKTIPVGEYDRNVTILTKERGKISAFARGARRQTSRLCAAANPFSFGTFRLIEGKSAYNIAEADISKYFEGLRSDYESACYGMYFLETADYYTRENNDEKEMLRLLYQSIRALESGRFQNPLVRYIFEIRAMVINGEFPGIPEKMTVDDSTRYAVSFIAQTPVEKLYTFTVTQNVLEELGRIGECGRRRVIDRDFKSLDVLDKLQLKN